MGLLKFWEKQIDLYFEKHKDIFKENDYSLNNPRLWWYELNKKRKYTYVKIDESIDVDCHQGVAASENYYYTFHTDRIDKRSKNDWSIVSQNTDPFAGMSGVDHVGDGCYYNNKLYIPVEHWTSCTDTSNQTIAIYDADTLELLEHHDISDHASEASSIAIDSENKIIYVSNYCNGKIYKFDLNTFDYLGEFDTHISTIQGIAFTNRGTLLVSVDNLGRLYEIDTNGNIISSVASVSAGLASEGVAIDTDGSILWLQDDGTNQYVYVYKESTYYTDFEFDDLYDWASCGGSATWSIDTSKKVSGLYSLKGDAGTSSGANRMFIYKKKVTSDKFYIKCDVYCFYNGTTNNPGGIALHALPDGSGKAYSIELSGGDFAIRKMSSQTGYTNIAIADNILSSYDQWFTFEVKYDDGTISARLLNTDGSVIQDWISGTDTSYQTGFVGVRIWRNQNWFDNFIIVEL